MDFQNVEKIIVSNNVLLKEGFMPAAIGIGEDGTIISISTDLESVLKHDKVEDFGDLMILPGVVDSHVHVNEPGRTEWEGFWTVTRAAASGGVTTIVDMPLNSVPPTTSVANFHEKLESCKGKLHTDVAFWGGVIPSNIDELLALVESGVVGFKCFLCPSGVDEFPCVSWGDVRRALDRLKGSDTVLAFHAEDQGNECAEQSPLVKEEADAAEYNTFLATRPPSFEINAVEEICRLCPEYGVRCHIVHASSSDVVKKVHETKESTGAKITVETCYHYLTLESELVPRGATVYKCCPPIRNKSNQDELWNYLFKGDIDLVVSDHSPCPPAMKGESDFLAAWGGISSVQFGLSLLWTAAKPRGLTIEFLSNLVSTAPAKLCQLHSKGSLSVGKDADMVVFDPDQEWNITEDCINHRHKITPYLGMKLRGRVIQTILRGQTIYSLGQSFAAPLGKIILLKKLRK